MWESKDSNFSAYDLQSLLAAPASFPKFAEDIGIEPCPFEPLRFSRPLVPMHATLQAENCGPDPHPSKRTHDLAGRPYPGRLVLHCAPDRIRTCKISGLSGTRLPVTSQAPKYPWRDSNSQHLDPKSSVSASWTTGAENKKASDFSEAAYNRSDKPYPNAIQPRPTKRYKYELYSELKFITQR